jgi:hypothetical protein
LVKNPLLIVLFCFLAPLLRCLFWSQRITLPYILYTRTQQRERKISFAYGVPLDCIRNHSFSSKKGKTRALHTPSNFCLMHVCTSDCVRASATKENACTRTHTQSKVELQTNSPSKPQSYSLPDPNKNRERQKKRPWRAVERLCEKKWLLFPCHHVQSAPIKTLSFLFLSPPPPSHN